jgi:hypothetical protein
VPQVTDPYNLKDLDINTFTIKENIMIDLENMPAPTEEEIAQARLNALNADRPESWTWDEELVSYVAPVSVPDDGYPYLWDEATTSWTPFPDFPRE